MKSTRGCNDQPTKSELTYPCLMTDAAGRVFIYFDNRTGFCIQPDTAASTGQKWHRPTPPYSLGERTLRPADSVCRRPYTGKPIVLHP